MQLKIKILNFLQKTSFLQLILISLLSPLIAQEVVIVDSTGVAKDTEIIEQKTINDTLVTLKDLKPQE